MLIIVEGVDGSGKSTLIKRLKRPGVTLTHRGPIKNTPLQEYVIPLTVYEPMEHKLIADRWHVGEMVYGPLYRGESQVSPAQATWIEMFLDSRGAAKLWMDTPLEVIQRRLAARGEDFLQSNHVEQVRDFYRGYCSSRPGWIAVPHDYDQNYLSVLLDYAKMRALRPVRNYVGDDSPDIIFALPTQGSIVGTYPQHGSTSEAILDAMSFLKRREKIGFMTMDTTRPPVPTKQIIRAGIDIPLMSSVGSKAEYIRWMEKTL